MPVETYAIVKDGIVTNVVVWDAAAQPDFEFDGEPVLCTGVVVEVKSTYDGTNFTRPGKPPPPILEHEAYIACVNASYSQAQASMFVDAVKREELRLIALGTVQAIRNTATHAEAEAALQQGIKSMQSAIKEIP